MKTENKFIQINESHRFRKGGALVGVIGSITVLGALGLSMVSLTNATDRSHLTANAGSRAYYLAESGLDYAEAVYRSEGWLHGRERSLTLMSGESVDVIRLFDNFLANSTADPATVRQARTEVPAAVDLTSDAPFQTPRAAGDFVIFGEDDYTTHSSTDIFGSVGLTEGHLRLNGDVDGDILASRVTFDAIATVDGSIFSGSTVDIRNGSVTGDIHGVGPITMQANTTLVGGWIFSETSVHIIQGAGAAGNIHAANGDVTVTGGASIGSSSQPVEVRASGNVILQGSGTIHGDVYAGGSVTLTGGTRIFGDIYAGGSVSHSNGTIISGTVLPNSPDAVRPPIPPHLAVLDGLALPEPAQFSSGGSNHQTRQGTSSTLSPGSHGHLQASGYNGGAELTLNGSSTGHALYFFDSVTLGQAITLKLDLSGSNDIRIFVNGNIRGNGDLRIQVSTDGVNYNDISSSRVDPQLASRVYWEATGDFHLAFSSRWFGTVYTPNGRITTAFGPTMIGEFLAKEGHFLPGGNIQYVGANYLK